MLYGYYDELPKPLSENELITMFQLYKNGSEKAFEQLVIHNLLLIKYIISKKFYNSRYDKEELFSVGELGLMEAIKKYDYFRDTKFVIYAGISIERAIIRYLRVELKHQNNLSLDKTITKDGNREVSFGERLIDLNSFIEEKMLEQETLDLIYKIIEEIPNAIEKEIMFLYFNNDIFYRQHEIAKIYGFHQSKVCRILAKNIKSVRNRIISLEEEKENIK